MTKAFAAVFRAEVRTARRLARTWVFGILAVATTCIGYLYFSALHASMSNLMASVVTSPRFLVDSFGGYLLWFLLAAAVFLTLLAGETIADRQMWDFQQDKKHLLAGGEEIPTEFSRPEVVAILREFYANQN